MANENIYKEDISISYFSAICADAQIDYDRNVHDDDSADAYFKKKVEVDDDGTLCHSLIAVQLKCTELSSHLCSIKDNYIGYQLKVKNYNDLCAKRVYPIILALLVIPKGITNFVLCNKENLLIHGRMFWLSLKGYSKSKNKSSVTIKIPVENMIDQAALIELLKRAGRRDL